MISKARLDTLIQREPPAIAHSDGPTLSSAAWRTNRDRIATSLRCPAQVNRFEAVLLSKMSGLYAFPERGLLGGGEPRAQPGSVMNTKPRFGIQYVDRSPVEDNAQAVRYIDRYFDVIDTAITCGHRYM